MLRNDYILKYKEKNQFESDNKYAQDDDNFILNSYRPLSEKSITSLPSKHLQNFVDEVLSNKKLSTVLYSSNAKSEIKILEKSNEFMAKNGVKLRRKQLQNNNPNDIVINRKKKETIAQMKTETSQYKTKRNQEKRLLTDKCEKFFQTLQDTKRRDEDDFIDTLNINRKYRFEHIFYSIKNKFENYYSNDKKERSGKIFNNTKMRLKSIQLPNLELNLQDVYSRLYHNAVLIEPKSTKGSISCLDTQISKIKAEPGSGHLSTKNSNLQIKNVIESTNGKEFTIKVTDEILEKCFSKHSGGPSSNLDKVRLKLIQTTRLRQIVN
jgi:hypothetical protein